MFAKLLVLLHKKEGFYGYNQSLHHCTCGEQPLFLLWSEEIHHCPKCDATLCRCGWRTRSVIAPDGILETYRIRRLYCPECKKIHHELPDFIVPYKRYCTEVIESILDGATWDVPCDDSTVRQMRNWFCLVADELLKLKEKQHFPLGGEQKDFSPLQKMKQACGSGNGWLCNAVMLLVKTGFYVKSTRFLC